MFFKCKNCGGNVIYSPERRGMFCPHCESVDSGERAEGDRGGEMTLCPNCGGELKVETHTSATRCPYCDSYLIFNERVEGQYEPKRIIPFALGKEACKKSIRAKFEKCLFAPTDFLSEVRLNSMQGIYVPYWFYNYDMHCTFQGEGTRLRTWRSGDIQYTETSFYAVDRDMDIGFRDIPMDASEKMPDDLMDLVAPFNYAGLTDFRPEYMSGFYSEKYNMTADVTEGRAKRMADEDAQKLLRESCAGYHSLRTIRQECRADNASASYGLLPVWKYIYSYQSRDYPFYVNGQTGKIVGTAPISAKKVWAYAGTLWACLTVLLMLAANILGYFL